MENTNEQAAPSGLTEIRTAVREAIQELLQSEHNRTEPAYKTELVEEKRKREDLERRLNMLAEENRRNRAMAEEAERNSSVRAELQRLGVAKIDLAYRAVKDDIVRGEDGRLLAKTGQGEVPIKDFLHQFVSENPELLPARNLGGSGAGNSPRTISTPNPGVDLDKIKPGMNADELARVRQEIARIVQNGFGN